MIPLTVEAKWANNVIQRYAQSLDAMHAKYPQVIPRIINQVGDRAKTQVIRALTAQTGLPRRTIVKAIGDPRRAHGNSMSYEMRTRGGNIRLKYLKPRETRRGVTAAPWGQRRLYPGTFMKGGAFPNRKVVPAFDGHVYRRLDRAGRKLTQERSGMFIPTEMNTGATRSAFLSVAEALLAERLLAALAKLMPGG